MASDRARSALGVVLSGTASDGTEGLRAIQENDGITFVQEPRTAKFPGMPQSAIARAEQKFRFDQRPQQPLTRRTIQPPEPLRLCSGQSQPGHFDVLAADAPQDVVM